jgi:hypothetical protein
MHVANIDGSQKHRSRRAVVSGELKHVYRTSLPDIVELDAPADKKAENTDMVRKS